MHTMCEAVSVSGRVTAKARVQQYSVLSPLLFIIMMKVLSPEFTERTSMQIILSSLLTRWRNVSGGS